MNGTGTTTVQATDRILVRVLPDVLEYIQANCGIGGVFSHPGHALERCIAILRLEHQALEAHCRATRQPLDPDAFAKVYEADLAATTPGKPGRPPRDQPHGVARLRLHGNVSVEVLDWARATLVEAGPFETMSQVAEVAVRRHRRRPLPPFDASALVAEYERHAKR
jgi:hypothetical protein